MKTEKHYQREAEMCIGLALEDVIKRMAPDNIKEIYKKSLKLTMGAIQGRNTWQEASKVNYKFYKLVNKWTLGGKNEIL